MYMMDTAIILAGGKSERMGFDKKLIEINNRLLMDIIIERLSTAFKEIIIVTNKEEEYLKYGCNVVKDEIGDFGPLEGIQIGLKNSSSMYSYVTACDMLNINMDYVRYMKQIISGSKEKPVAVITRFGEWLEPFNAFYSRALLSKIEINIRDNKKRISLLFEDSNTIYIEESKAREYSPDWRMFENINTSDDLERVIYTYSTKSRNY